MQVNMDYRSTYQSFINSYYLSEGIRITVGLTLPAVIGTYLHHENIGITLSIGAVCVTIVDSAGPVLHRKNAMLVCNAVIFMVSLLTGFAVDSPVALGLLITVFCFVFSMIGIYGARAGSIGLAGLFVMVLNLTKHLGPDAILLNAFYILCGGVWYMLLSLSLYSFRPYKVTQQALGDLIQETGNYILLRTAFYEKDPDYETIYALLLEKQVEINDKQNLVRELLYKSRDFVKESTNTGRITLLIFIDINDFLERVMSLQLHHRQLHVYFDQTAILDIFKRFLILISDELNKTGIALKSGRAYPTNDALDRALADFKKNFEDFKSEEISPDNIEGFIGLRTLVNACEDFVTRIQAIQRYTGYDLKNTKQDVRVQNYDQFITHQDIDAKVFWENFTWRSNTFRHSLRVSVATLSGFIISEFLPFGHSYWILLTIIVILKPAYSITKRRNRDRLLGTLAGAAVGIVILFLVKDRQLMIACMMVLMVLAYTFMRTRYLLFVTFMTPYILILLYILNPVHFTNLIADRVIDTGIGSSIALLANILFSPEWVYKQFTEYLQQMLEANKNYFVDAVSSFTGNTVDITQYKLSRKHAYVALANISDALNRMLAEPKSKQRNAAGLNQIVVLNYMLASHIATLNALTRDRAPITSQPDYNPVIGTVIHNLNKALEILTPAKMLMPSIVNSGSRTEVASVSEIKEIRNADSASTINSTDKILNSAGQAIDIAGDDGAATPGEIRQVNEQVSMLVNKRKSELEHGIRESETSRRITLVKSVNDQFNFIWKISDDLLKIVAKVNIICFLYFAEKFFL
jgi:uncharacterized membrane protein (TIGR01666 family)